MAHIFRIALIGALFSPLFALNASAAPPSTKYGYSGPGYYEPRTWLPATFDSANEACEKGIAALNAKGHGGYHVAGDTYYGEVQCYRYRPGLGSIGPLGEVFTELGCAQGEKLVDGQCTSPGPSAADLANKRCGDDFKYAGWHVGGQYTDIQHVSGRIEHGVQFCVPFDGAGSGKGCKVEFSLNGAYQNDDKSWSSYGTFSPVENNDNGSIKGEACTPSDSETPGEGETKKPQEPECKNGYKGEVNGVSTCVPNVNKNGVDLGGDKSTETKPDGTKVDTEKKTTCEGGKCTTTTTTTTTTTSGGKTTDTTTITQDEKAFCTANPSKCSDGKVSEGKGKDDKEKEGEKGKFGGSCQAGFTCEGDALQCAIAREQHKRNCELWEKDTDSGSLTNRALNGTDDKSADTMRANAQQVAVGTFDQAGLGWSSSCPADPSIPLNFGGTSSEFTIPFSRICGPLSILSMAGVGITLLGCMVWVLGDKKAA